jgi:hypothetical protein
MIEYPPKSFTLKYAKVHNLPTFEILWTLPQLSKPFNVRNHQKVDLFHKLLGRTLDSSHNLRKLCFMTVTVRFILSTTNSQWSDVNLPTIDREHSTILPFSRSTLYDEWSNSNHFQCPQLFHPLKCVNRFAKNGSVWTEELTSGRWGSELDLFVNTDHFTLNHKKMRFSARGSEFWPESVME